MGGLFHIFLLLRFAFSLGSTFGLWPRFWSPYFFYLYLGFLDLGFIGCMIRLGFQIIVLKYRVETSQAKNSIKFANEFNRQYSPTSWSKGSDQATHPQKDHVPCDVFSHEPDELLRTSSCKHQQGFRKRHSTVTALHRVTHHRSTGVSIKRKDAIELS